VVEPAELVASFFTLTGAGFGEPPRHRFVERCAAASTAGFTGIGLHVDDLPRTLAGGLSVADMRAVLADHDLAVVEIEFVGGWVLEPDGPALADIIVGVEAVADAFGGRHVSAGEFRGMPDGGRVDVDAAGRRLGEIAHRLADRGLTVAVEAFPWSALRDVATAVEVLRRADAPTAGLMVDVWHFYNGGTTLDQLDDLPGVGVAAVQLNDGPRVHDDFLVNARAHRRLPGEGDLDVAGLLAAVRRAGFAGPYCVEVNTPQFRALPVVEAAARAHDTAAAALRASAERPSAAAASEPAD
jgi:sugar phosphate isomerase/epimerase